ncbi:MAG: LysM peptidoglycan-binding domain-containing protein [Caldilineaceae bacterium SB0664_bin_22]|nr:LysM peptidoglycan-binding domain-containing protein [Caldilineaceae bacterium SB0664_bin_22]
MRCCRTDIEGIRCMATFVANRWGRVCLLLLVLGLAVALVPSQALLAQGQNQHVVRTGDTLYSIAARYGTTVDAIVALNGLSSGTYIHVGQVLRIPGTSGASASGGTGCSATHVVQAGENLLAIALWYEVSMAAIVSANGIANANQIGIGQELCIPSGTSGVVQAPVSTPTPTGPSQATTHTVAAGENLYRIALRYGVPTGLLMAVNGITDPTTLSIGQVLVIPGTDTTVTQPAPVQPAPAPATQPPAVTGVGTNEFRASYWNNADLSGTPVLSETVSAPLNLNWGLGSPGTGVAVDGFSAKFEGDFTFAAGTYRFTSVVDDGMRLYIDDVLFKDAWLDQAASTYFADVILAQGTHRVRLEYYDRNQNAQISLRWEQRSQVQAPAPPTQAPAPTPTQAPAPTPTQAPTPVSQPAATLDFAYGIQAHALEVHNSRPVLRAVNDLGFTWLKQQVRWKDMEPSRGNRQWVELDDLVDRADRANVNVLFSVVAAPAWAREPGADLNVAGPPLDDQDFANYLGALASRYCNSSVKALEVWNEQNLHYEWGNLAISANDYIAMLRAANIAIRAACPTMFIISGAPTPTGNNGAIAVDDLTYMESMLAAGMANYVDGIGAHPSGYNLPPDIVWQDGCATIQVTGNTFNGACDNPHHSWSFRSTMEGYRALAVKYGAADKKIVPTEFGWAAGGKFHPSYAYADDNSYLEQADWTVQAYRMMKGWGWVGPAILWNLNFRVVGDGTEQAQWGIVRSDWSPLPAYDALKAEPK